MRINQDFWSVQKNLLVQIKQALWVWEESLPVRSVGENWDTCEDTGVQRMLVWSLGEECGTCRYISVQWMRLFMWSMREDCGTYCDIGVQRRWQPTNDDEHIYIWLTWTCVLWYILRHFAEMKKNTYQPIHQQSPSPVGLMLKIECLMGLCDVASILHNSLVYTLGRLFLIDSHTWTSSV